MALDNFVVGKVGALTGKAWARNEIGVKRALKLGDEIYEGDQIITETGGRVELDFGLGKTHTVAENSQLIIDTTVYGDGEVEATRLAVLERDAQYHNIETQIANSNTNLDALLENTASGGGGAGTEHYGRANLPTLERISEAAELGQLHFAPAAGNNSTPPEGRASSLGGTTEAALSVQSLSAAQVLEGGTLQHTVQLNQTADGKQHLNFSLNFENASAADIGNISFSNGVSLQDGQLSIPAGVNQFTISIPTLADRVAEGTETLALHVGAVNVQDSIVDNAALRLAAPALAWHLAEPATPQLNAAHAASLHAHDVLGQADPLSQLLGQAAAVHAASLNQLSHHDLAALLSPILSQHENLQHTPT